MNHFEDIYKRLSELLMGDFSEVCTKINQKHNDGILISPLNKSESKLKPYFEISFESAEKSEKDILIENEVYNLSIGFHLNEQDKDCKIKLWRYFEAVDRLIKENESVDFWQSARVSGTNENKIAIRIVI